MSNKNTIPFTKSWRENGDAWLVYKMVFELSLYDSVSLSSSKLRWIQATFLVSYFTFCGARLLRIEKNIFFLIYQIAP